MLQACFVVRVAPGERQGSRQAKLFCRWDPPEVPGSPLPPLPAADNLTPFCFPLSLENVGLREHMAAEVRRRCGWAAEGCASVRVVPVCGLAV